MTISRGLLLVAAAMLVMGVGCANKKVAVNPPPPPPPSSTPMRSTPTPAPAPVSASNTPVPVASTPATRYPSAATRARIDQLLARIEDAYFDYDKHTLRPDAIQALQADSNELRDILKDYPDYKLTIEGHCDERGSEEYNLALGDARAKAAQEYLAGVGIPASQFAVISYGKERPVCEDHDEACWQKNRRIHFVAQAQQ